MSATINSDIFNSYFNTFKFKQLEIGSKTHYPIKSIFLDKQVDNIVDKGINIILEILDKDNDANILLCQKQLADSLLIRNRFANALEHYLVCFEALDNVCKKIPKQRKTTLK